MWSYVTEAPPGTAIHYRRSQGWTLGDKIAAEQLHAQRALGWYYGARNFEGGSKSPFPIPIDYPGSSYESSEQVIDNTPKTLDELVSPEVRELLRGA